MVRSIRKSGLRPDRPPSRYMSVRVRFAPSPTGHLHVGGARTALFNWLLARSTGGTFVLRVEDTDRDRSSEEMVEGILHGMEWLGLDWDEGPSFQSAGLERHRADALRLLDLGRAYRDFTTAEELGAIRAADPARATRYPREQADRLSPEESEARLGAAEAHAIRFRMPPGETSWEDLVHGPTRFDNDDIEDLVLLRSDGTPTYNLAVASDDAEMRISHVIRGDDHLSNTPKQILIHEALGRSIPKFAHVPMILGPDGKRLSKRHGATAVGDYEEKGILPEAMVNFLALLGWSPGTDEEVMTREELIQKFSLDRVLKKSAIFDQAKLEWLSGQHLSRLPAVDLVDRVLDELEPMHRAWARDRGPWFVGVVDLLKRRARTVGDIAAKAEMFFDSSVDPEPEAVKKHWAKDPHGAAELLSALHEAFVDVNWDAESLESTVRSLAHERGIGAGKVIHPLRVALTGQAVSPGIFEVLFFLGRELTLRRIREATAHLRGIRAPSA